MTESDFDEMPAIHIDRMSILGYDVVCSSRSKCVEYLMHRLDEGTRGRYIVCLNPHSVVEAEKDAEFHRAIAAADLVLPDGAGIVMAGRALGGWIPERITGSDIFSGVSAALERRGNGRYFFLGSTAENLQLITQRMAKLYPRIEVAGTYAPPMRQAFSPVESADMLRAISEAQPDVLWVGMTAPKQEKWVFANLERIEAPIVAPVGAVFDFVSGKVRRSHRLFQQAGLEWLPRLLREPRRLWRRTLVSGPKFMLLVASARTAAWRSNAIGSK